MACRTTGLLLIDKGEIEPGINVIKQILVNWLRQTEGALHTSTNEYWEEIIKQLGWTDNSPTNITDHRGQTRDLNDWQELVYDGIKRARQQAWEKCAKDKPNYKEGWMNTLLESITRSWCKENL
eukprot:13810563-Heterocapsa_arctica.AAC.1